MIKRLCALFVMIMVLMMLVSCVSAAEYSAVITNTTGKGKSQEIGKLYVNGKNIRCDMKTPQGSIIQILSGKKVWMINPSVREYFEMPAQRTSLGFYITAKDAKSPKGVKSAGVGTYDNYICDKYSITKNQEKIGNMTTTIWVSRKLGAVIKIDMITPKGMSSINFKVHTGKQKASLFELPKGYKKTQMKQQQQRPMQR